MFFRQSHKKLSFKDVTDGLANTIFLGEVRRDCSWHVQKGWAMTNNGQGLACTLIPINWESCRRDATDGCRQPESWNSELGFKSLHPGGVNLLMGDASVHFVREDIDHQTYQYLGARADGQAAELP